MSHNDHWPVHLTAPHRSMSPNGQNSGRSYKMSTMANRCRYRKSKPVCLNSWPWVQEREEEVIITKNGRPPAMLINVDQYTRLKETVNVLSDPGLMSQIAESRALYKTKRKGLSFEDVFGEPSRSSRSVARRDSLAAGHPSACRGRDPLTSSRSQAPAPVGDSRHECES